MTRKAFGHWHIAGPHDDRLTSFHREIVARCLNYHYPRLFAHVETDADGKQRKACRSADIRKPYEVLKALTEAKRYLRPVGERCRDARVRCGCPTNLVPDVLGGSTCPRVSPRSVPPAMDVVNSPLLKTRYFSFAPTFLEKPLDTGALISYTIWAKS